MSLTPEIVKPELHFKRFSKSQRWEHTLLLFCVLVLLLTGLPQKYRTAGWSQYLLSTPERVQMIQQIHHAAALLLTAGAIYHLGKGILQLARRQLPADIFPVWQDFKDAWQMILFLLFLSKDKPKFRKYNFEQKVTYWFIFFGVGILIVTGYILWFPEVVTRLLPGGVIPAAKLAHSSEAIVLAVFIVVWHFYHVHLERLNLSIFTGKLNEEDMQTYHALEYQRLTASQPESPESGGEG